MFYDLLRTGSVYKHKSYSDSDIPSMVQRAKTTTLSGRLAQWTLEQDMYVCVCVSVVDEQPRARGVAVRCMRTCKRQVNMHLISFRYICR